MRNILSVSPKLKRQQSKLAVLCYITKFSSTAQITPPDDIFELQKNEHP